MKPEDMIPHTCNSPYAEDCTKMDHPRPVRDRRIDPDLCPKCGDSLAKHASLEVTKGVFFYCPPDVIEVPRAAYEDLVDGVEAMGDRPPSSRAEWMARDLVKAVEAAR